jgi:hypothetical protein
MIAGNLTLLAPGGRAARMVVRIGHHDEDGWPTYCTRSKPGRQRMM